ncbi:hypothetical protein CEY16_06640 [Halalkalibacillus sediminis]|uniref:Integral membrane protein n=1 Tax=Halalkalibacillus sediminis TaxID=2018042 RepID=A0A2I0QU36_9BACI|nr:hypothetical protein [Halalkalibacillus sediminis]PKR77610.1 hypothetical protein CEY16_06640 [Halalkalibacillus sediminis]
MEIIIDYQWEIFIVAEILSLVALLLFGFLRYFLNQKKLSLIFIFVFLGLLALEALLGFLIYRVTGEMSTFQIVIIIFVVYACTFGVYDFIKLDRWMRKKFSQWRGVDLLTDKDYRAMEQNKDPKYIARKYRYSSMIHLIIFVAVQLIFWIYGTSGLLEMKEYLTDFSWIEEGRFENSPYPNETIYQIGMIWGIVFVADFLYSWSYTIFPSSEK